MEQKELLDFFEKEFLKIKADLGFKAGLDEIDKIFFVKDMILKEGFVSEMLSRQICTRITETLMQWNSYVYNLIFPNPGDMILGSESKAISQEDKNELWKLMRKSMELVSRNSIIGLSKDKKIEAKFIDDSLDFWNMKFNPKVIEIVKKINSEWGK
ncbi:hypothetical protein COU60_04275 [Candidatus Pacearchaeota archaeon CG10_big_fil_rev_8_21_14_0_10_34_76]|nr:MAG: hypothetical protein COU60_04275 [Candidatus Pacearchaeota archaeon CG10_big_fil_rev_8_21_14_0_10_34_76]